MGHCLRGRLLFAVLFALLCAGPGAFGAEDASTWRAGLARVKITPEGPVWLAGYGARNKPSNGVLADIYAKAMALEDHRGHTALLVTFDVTNFRAAVAAAACQKIQERTGLDRSQILLTFSHTHTGPVVDLSEESAMGAPPDEQKRVRAYTQALLDKLPDLAVAALADRKPAKLSWGRGAASFGMNRREPNDQGVGNGVNPRGYVDRTVPVLKVTDPDGKPRAIVFGYACHNTTLTGQFYVVSGDYAGFAQEYIESQLPGAQAMFMIGCAGDVNPYPRGKLEYAKQYGADLGAEACRVAGTKMQPVRGPLTALLENAQVRLAPVPSREELIKMTKGPAHIVANAKRMLAAVEKNEPIPPTYPAPIAVWQFGSDLTLVGISGEVLGGYVPMVERSIGPLRLWIAGYTNDIFGYLPTAEALRQGGYETRGLLVAAGFFAPESQDDIIAKVHELAVKAGRKMPVETK